MTTDLDKLADALRELAASYVRIADALRDTTAVDPTPPDTRQTLVAELQVGDVVLFGRNDPDEIVARVEGRLTNDAFCFASNATHEWAKNETVPVVLVDCPACDGHGFGQRCGCCDGTGRVTGGTARHWRAQRTAVRPYCPGCNPGRGLLGTSVTTLCSVCEGQVAS